VPKWRGYAGYLDPKGLPQPFPGHSSDWDLHDTIINGFESV
jgi:hypothetical protein